MSSFTGSFGDSPSRLSGSTRSFDEDDDSGYDPRLPSQRFDSSFTGDFGNNSIKETATGSSPTFTSHSYGGGNNVFSSEQNNSSNGDPILPLPAEMELEKNFALMEWRRENAKRLEEKERKEKEMLKEIIEEAGEYKREFYRKRQSIIENEKKTNREKEEVSVATREKFHSEAEKNYWKAIADLIPREVAVIEKRGKKDREKKPSIVVIQGPKPGKPTDMSRMRQILLKLKHDPPLHMKPKSPPPSTEPKKEGKAAAAATAAETVAVT